MKFSLVSFVSGLLFGFGLMISGLANPDKVLGFLDLAGLWDPSLALVMAGAIGVGLFGFMVAKKRTVTVFGGPLRLPTATQIDKRLVLGSLAFGVGWGLAGFCPGPALVGLGAGEIKALVFTASMVAGMAIFELFERGWFAPGKAAS
ncbi:DUF6691 family protein [Marinobacter zhejiangensis]|uniref:Sulphur transport domain-containing protein n=1 Tax=Marinobacter zhejiangensis TaxID=488535 RepID=A0A1I4RWA7_9GAMM|nr:DUF6691 family protein [Marinobacter zhejiangensis]SFM56537.1 hypothetical protein SAMN04487963_2989 [Marinobacter zhejiangensis]